MSEFKSIVFLSRIGRNDRELLISATELIEEFHIGPTDGIDDDEFVAT